MYDFDPAELPVGHVDLAEAVRNIDGDRELFDAVAAMLIADAPTYLAEYRARFAAGQVADARRAAHTFKGVAGSIGAFRLMALVRRLEIATDAESAADIDRLLAEADSEVAAVVARLREIVGG